MKYKLLVLDIDGTLTDGKNVLTPFTKQTLEKVQKKGIKVVLASGRPTYGVMPLAKELELAKYGGYILSFNGGKIIDMAAKQTVYQSIIDQDLIPELYKLSREFEVAIVSYKDEYIITEDPEDRFVQHEAYLTKMKPQKVDDFCKATGSGFEANKCLAAGEPEKLIEMEKVALEHFGDRMNIYRSLDCFLELVPKTTDKALSLERLLEHLGLEREQMVAVGDGFNDLAMIKYAGFGVAMGNAQQAVKDAADHITLSNDENGVAHMAIKYLL